MAFQSEQLHVPHTNDYPAAPVHSSTAPLRLAIVEDEPLVAHLIREMLAHSPVEVAVFTHSAELLNCPELLNFAAIVLDLSMPDIDGFDLMGRLAPLQHPAKILLIGGVSQAVLRASHLYGKRIGLNVAGLLCKPFSRDELLIALNLLE